MVELLSHGRENMDFIRALGIFCMRPTGRELCRSVVYMVFGPSNLYFDELLRTISNHIPGGARYNSVSLFTDIFII